MEMYPFLRLSTGNLISKDSHPIFTVELAFKVVASSTPVNIEMQISYPRHKSCLLNLIQNEVGKTWSNYM